MLRSTIPSQKEISELPEKIKKLMIVVEFVKSGSIIPISKQQSYLSLLADFECWDMFIQAVKIMTKVMLKDRLIDYHGYVSRICFNYLENYSLFEDLLIESSKSLKMPFNVFWRLMINDAMDHKDYVAEARALEKLILKEPNKQFAEKALERLVLLYEEKIYNDELINNTYKKLLRLNANNVKALIYFKNICTQRQDWKEVEHLLKSLIVSNQLTIEKNYYIIELAAVYLNYLNETNLAKDLLKQITGKNGYHTCKTKFCLLSLSGEYSSAFDCLKDMLEVVEDPSKKAHIYFHLALTRLNLNEIEEAFADFEKSLECKFYPFVAKKFAKMAMTYGHTSKLEGMLKAISNNVTDHQLKKKARVINYRFFVKG